VFHLLKNNDIAERFPVIMSFLHIKVKELLTFFDVYA
jgi:hypothetical protein